MIRIHAHHTLAGEACRQHRWRDAEAEASLIFGHAWELIVFAKRMQEKG